MTAEEIRQVIAEYEKSKSTTTPTTPIPQISEEEARRINRDKVIREYEAEKKFTEAEATRIKNAEDASKYRDIQLRMIADEKQTKQTKTWENHLKELKEKGNKNG